MAVGSSIGIIMVLTVVFQESTTILLPDRPRLKTVDGHLFLESAPGRNITLNSRGSGGVTVNGVDIARSYALIEAVRPQLETLGLASVQFLVNNLTRVVQNVASEARLALTLDEMRGKISTTTVDLNSLKSTVEDSMRLLQLLHTNVTQLSAVTMTEENKQLLRNVTQIVSQMQRNGGLSNTESSNQGLQNIRQSIRTLQIQVSEFANLDERVTSLESSGNGTFGTRVSGTTTLDVRRLKRAVSSINSKILRLMRAVFNDDCRSGPCHNGGTCIDTTTGFVCLCPGGYEGLSCNQDVNECMEFIGTDLGCQNGATCRNSPGSYSCVCTPGWFGIHCREKAESCSGSSASELCGHGTCIPSPKDGHPYFCLCDQGWKKLPGSPACNQDVDECQSERPPCSHDPPVMCVNTYGSFRCAFCPQGYEGNGFVCRDIDECQVNNGGCSLLPRVECINTRPGRRCGPCPPGYQGDGSTCTQLPRPCSTNPCHYLAVCSDNPQMSSTYFTCQCQHGYIGNGIGPNGCTINSQTGGGGSLGPSINPCANNPCLHGTCSVYMGNFLCTCLPGYTGPNCNQPIDMCALNLCQNGGTCRSTLGSFTCDCPSTHTGNLCQTISRNCGGLLEGHSGIVDYPGAGQTTYQHNISCAWVIKVNGSLVVAVNFTSFHLEPSYPQCNYDWLQIHDGPRSSYQNLGRYCDRTLPGRNGTIVSTHNYLYLWFRSDHSHAGSGFTFTWSAVVPECGGVFEGRDHGTINSPGYPGMYPRNRDCFWTVQVSRGKKIQFAFATLQLEHHTNCSFDFLEIKDGLSETDPALARFCSSTTGVPDPVITSASEAFVHFHSDISLQDTGFHITYASIPGLPGCGGLLTGDLGEFSLPTISSEYAHHLHCEWEIRVPVGEVIQLNFTRFSVEEHPSCRWDFVEVRDGGSRDSPLVGRYCGHTIPPPVISTRNSLFVYFASDYSISYEGFSARYEVACGGEYTAPTGTITSLFFPRPYPHNRICEYFIKLAPGKAIVMNFTSFEMEDTAPFCYFDYLEIHDGISASSPLFGRYCGPSHRTPPQIVSSLNGLYLKFKTDGSVSNKGFSAVYSSIDIACGGIYHSLAGTITYPSAPGTYTADTECRWVLAMPPGHIIQIMWQNFALEQAIECSYDYVEIFDNSSIPNTGGRIGNRFCGSVRPPVMTSVDNMMTIHFHSDSSNHHDGFSLTYHALDASRVCSGNYHTTSGRIRSPNFPVNYPNNRDCVWTISVPTNTQIKLNFTSFSVEHGEYCQHDYLEIRNGGYESSPLIQRLCGNNTVSDIFSHTHQLYLKFHSDYSVTQPGFEIFWDQTSTGCGGSLTSVTGEIMSPGYPQPFHRFADCFWTIRGNPGSKLTLTFVDLDLEDTPSCYGNYVEVRDGPRRTSRLIGRYCAVQGILSVNSTGNELSLKFKGGWTEGKRGFKARYHADCNTVTNKPNGVIESPNFPLEYPHNRNCTWKIMAPKGNAINITFSHFEVEDPHSIASGVCNYDFVELKVGQQSSPQRTVKGHYCGTRVPPQFFSGQGMDAVEVQFMSDFSIARNGFRLEWVVHGCGGIFRDFNGIFSSPNYPSAYPANTDCEWHFIAHAGMRIQIVIEEFDIESSFSAQECIFDSLKIYGGRDVTSPVLMTLCHHEDAEKTVSTQGGYALMRMESDGSVRGKGFKGRYKLLLGGCGGEFTAPKGEIHSPGYPDNYDNHADCVWNLRVDQNHVVEFEFKDFDIEPHQNCSYDYLALFDGETEDAPMLLQHCGEGLPTPAIVRSSGRFMTVRMKADASATGRGFKAEYRKGCGATLDVPLELGTNAITSPNFPRMFSVFANCTWHLKAPEGYKVMLTFTHLSIQQTRYAMSTNTSCQNDYVVVLDGDNLASPEVGRFCGTHVPRPVFSTSNYVTVQLVTELGFGVGFRTLYSSVDTACGGDLSSPSGELASPNYPDSYPRSFECVWTINVGEGNGIQLTFASFEIEESEGCNLDYLEIHERSPEGTLLMHNCSSTLPLPITAVGGFWLKFRSDDQGTGAGFLASYTLLTSNELSGDRGVIESPLYPHIFVGTQEFTWSILLTSWKYISITIENINIELNPVEDVCLSSLVIHDGNDIDSPVLRTLCGHSPPAEAIVSTRNALFIRFIAVFRHEGSAFRLRYETVDNRPQTDSLVPVDLGAHSNCTFLVFVNGTTQFTSPNYPENYNNNLRCEWIVQTEAHSRIGMFFTYELEESSSCAYDRIEIFDGIDGTRTWNKTHELCRRNQRTGFIFSTGQFMRVVFKSDSSVTRKGFSATVYRTCGGVLTEPDGIIQSPRYPAEYPNYSNCNWKIKMRIGRTIRMTFNNFRIANQTSSCADDYLLIYNGPTTSSPLLGIGRFCGRGVPTVPETSSNTALLQFRSDLVIADTGFFITYNEVSAACGGRHQLSRDMKSITINSPNYPNPPHPHTECVWIITGPPGIPITVHFIDVFDITWSSTCENAYVEVLDGGTQLSESRGRFCGTVLPNTVESTDSVVLIKYYTNAESVHTGFKAEVETGRCGGVYRLMGGYLTSNNYPEPYDPVSNCSWHVIGPFGHYLHFNFMEVNIYNPSVNCSSSTYGKLTVNDTVANTSVAMCTERISYPPFETASNLASIFFTNNHTGGSINRFKLTVSASTEVCGGTVTGPEGVIQSPGYPHGQAHVWSCEWKIRGPPGSKITLTFEDFDFDSVGSLCYQYLVIRNGIERYAPRLSRYLCGSELPPSFNSSMNTMKVMLYVYRPSANRGFKARYTAYQEKECGGYLSEASGLISSPGIENGGYNHSLFCVWTINNPNPSNSSINITVHHLHLEEGCYDFLLIEGLNPSGETISRVKICHGAEEIEYLAPYPTTRITFVSDHSINGSGFNISYGPSNCGGYFTLPDTTFTSPNYPNSYPDNLRCGWLFNFPDGAQVDINFSNFQLENSINHDFVKIYNGPSQSSPLIGQYSGTTSPGRVGPTSSNSVLVIFQSDGTNSARGFSATAGSHTRGCGGITHGINGNLSSPGFKDGRNYVANEECLWEVRMVPGYQVSLSFVERFDLETSDNCRNDFVQIFTPSNSSGVMTWIPQPKRCGKQMPSSFSSNSSSVQVLFRTNSAIDGKGFKVSYVGICGGIFTDYDGYIMSPRYPGAFPRSVTCIYTIAAPEDAFVVLNFTTLAIDFNTPRGCIYSNIQIQQNSLGNSMVTRRTLCGNTIPEPIILRGPVTLSFTSGRYSYPFNKGFMLKYSVKVCGGNITEPGVITLPTYPGRYMRLMNCVWDITAPEGQVVHIKFQSLDLEFHHNCDFDYLSIYDGFTSSNDKMISKFCGNHTDDPPVVTSRSSKSRIVFNSDSSYSPGYGFEASIQFTYDCGGVINISASQPSQTIRSLDANNDGTYEPLLNCQWLIVSNSDRVVTFNFTRLDVEGPTVNDTKKCPYDFLKVYDGSSKSTPLLGEFCGSNMTQRGIVGSRNAMLVIFRSDSMNQTAGFTATVSSVPRICGAASLTATTTLQVLESPNYPANYPTSIRCHWSISAPENTNIIMHINAFSLQDSPGCSADRLFIGRASTSQIGSPVNSGTRSSRARWAVNLNGRNAFFNFGSTDHQYCGTHFPHHLEVTSNQAELLFFSDETQTSSGFRLHYAVETCNTTYTTESGTISKYGRRDGNCYITITAENNRYVALYFSYIHLALNDGGSFKVYDGTDSSATLLADLRGYVTPSPIFSTGSSLRIEAIEPNQRTISYLMSYGTSDQPNGCGGRFFGKRTIITSPSYPGVPAQNLTCVYTLAVSSLYHVALRLSVLDFGGGGGCNSTYLEIYDVFPNDEARLFTKFCEGDNPADHLSPSNRMIVRYVTGSAAVNGTGWRAIVMEATPHQDTVFDVQEATTTAP